MPIISASAKAPILNNQVPYWYRFKIGSIEATVISDGPLPLGIHGGNVAQGGVLTEEPRVRVDPSVDVGDGVVGDAAQAVVDIGR